MTRRGQGLDGPRTRGSVPRGSKRKSCDRPRGPDRDHHPGSGRDVSGTAAWASEIPMGHRCDRYMSNATSAPLKPYGPQLWNMLVPPEVALPNPFLPFQHVPGCVDSHSVLKCNDPYVSLVPFTCSALYTPPHAQEVPLIHTKLGKRVTACLPPLAPLGPPSESIAAPPLTKIRVLRCASALNL